MTQQTGNDSRRIAAAINEAIELERRGQTNSAIELLTQVAAEFPHAAGVRSYLAWLSLQAGLNEAAMEHGRQSVKLAPAAEKASLVYFHALWKSGQRDQALNEMKRYLAIRTSEEYSEIIKKWGLATDST